MSAKTRGIASALVGAALWGFSGTCAQYLFARYEVPALFLTAFRMLASGLLFLALLLWRRRDALRSLLRDKSSRRQVIAFGAVGLLMCQLTYLMAISYTNAGTATVLQNLNIVFCLLVGLVVGRRGPRLAEVASLVCALAAGVLVSTKGDLSVLSIPLAGLVWGILNAASCTFYIMYPRRLFERWGSLVPTGLGMLVGGIAASVIFAIGCVASPATVYVPTLGGDGILVLAIIAVAGTFAAFGLYLHGVSLVGGVMGSLLGSVEPVSACVFSAVWIGTQFVGADWAGLVLMVAAVFLTSIGAPPSTTSER